MCALTGDLSSSLVGRVIVCPDRRLEFESCRQGYLLVCVCPDRRLEFESCRQGYLLDCVCPDRRLEFDSCRQGCCVYMYVCFVCARVYVCPDR